MEKRSNNFEFDFTSIGQAIKQSREARGMTREAVSEIVDYVPRHIQAIENEGQVPSVEMLVQLATMFDISIDEHIFKDKQIATSSVRRRVNTLLDGLDDKELTVIEGAIKGLYQAREFPDG